MKPSMAGGPALPVPKRINSALPPVPCSTAAPPGLADQGANSGITKGCPVVCSEGVVGQIFTTSPNYSKVLLLRDRKSVV